MRTVESFGPDGPHVSLLGFGCASVMGRVGRGQSLDAMACAVDHGITHFDVARSYGFGDAEKVLGHFIKGRRDKFTVTSKFGIVAPQLKTWQRIARPVVRPLRSVLAPLRRQMRAASGQLLGATRHDVGYARECLEKSLRELGTDYLDFYLLHEPSLTHLPEREALHDFMEGRVRAGQIRAWGVAHPVEDLKSPVAPLKGLGTVLQQPSSFGAARRTPSNRDHQPDVRRETRFRFITQPMAGGDSTRIDPALVAVARTAGLSHVDAMFAWACHEAGPSGAVIAGMYSRAHIVANAVAVERYAANRARFEGLLG